LATAVSACGSGGEPTKAAVSTNSDAPLVITSSAPAYESKSDGPWFRHELTLENSSDRAIVVDYSQTATFLNDYGLLVADGGCGYSPPNSDNPRPSTPCSTFRQMPLNVAPHASATLPRITVNKGRPGMTKLQPGTYVWNKEVSWHYADSSETQLSKLAITYTIG
jgi:hypothetical protein